MTKAAELAKMGEVLTNSQIGGRRNIVINGGMQVAQRATTSGTGGVGSANGVFPTVDRFSIFAGNTAGRATMTQEADGPSGFANCIKLDCTTADTSIAADEFFGLRTRFEGQDLQQFKKGTSDAEKITVSFYVKGNASATYQLELKDQDNTRVNPQTFAVTTSWSRVILTFNADTSGTFDDDNAVSMTLSFWLHAGSTYTSGTFTSNTWASQTQANRVNSSNTSFFDSTDRTFFITGVQMEVGSKATPFEHRSFGEELQLCQRYFEKSYNAGTAPASDTSAGLITTDTMAGDTTTAYLAHQLQYRVTKRAAATVVVYDQAEASGKVTSHVTGVGTNNGQTASTEHSGDKSISILRASGDAANGFRYHYTADAEL
jgi:hypothetical protein